MKRFLLFVAVLLTSVVAAYAQPRAIGARIGYGVNVSYQHSLSDKTMLNMDFGIPGFCGVEAAITHDWIDPFGTSVPWNERGEWHWYMGVGAGLTWYWGGTVNTWEGRHSWGGLGLGVAGRVGVEYDFWFPMQISVDWRPIIGPSINYNTWNVAGHRETNTSVGYYTGGLYAGAIAIAVRYNF